MDFDQEKFNELGCYTLDHKDPDFIHQLIVDAHGAQVATKDSKPIGVYFALMGLYLHLEKNYTGRQVQLAHIKVAKNKKVWPIFELPGDRGAITASHVMAAPAGKERDDMIEKWCASVWSAYKNVQEKVCFHTDQDLA